jgi:polyphenol oxidase
MAVNKKVDLSQEISMSNHRRFWHGGTGAAGRMSRRDFIAGSLLAGTALMAGAKAWAQAEPVIPLHCVPPLPPGPGTLFAPADGPLRVRKSVFDLNAGEIARLKNAYAELRKLTQQNANDPRGWYHQGEVHCWYCSGALDNLYGIEIHGGWWFLAWHRAYLYFHEKILGALINDPTFALPYWDWDSCTDDPNDQSGRNRFPGEVYGFPGDTTNPLFDPTRAVGPNDRIDPIWVGPTAMQPIMTAASFTEFGGSGNQELSVVTQPEGDPQQMGALEAGPHGLVHVWTTDPSGFSGAPDMGALASAGFDPVFYAHHANIDRLWDVWIQNPAHANPANSRWLTDQPFLFYDQVQMWTGIFAIQMTNPEDLLLYRYQPPNWPAAAPTAAVATSPRAAPRVAQAAPLSAPLVELSASAEPKVLPPQPTTLQVAVPPAAKARMKALAAPGSASALVLRIDGVEIPADRGAVIQVYVNRPDATVARRAERGYVGSMVIVPSTAPGALHLHRPVHRNFGFALTAEQTDTLANQDDISVTLVPVTGETNKPAEVLRYRRVYLASR